MNESTAQYLLFSTGSLWKVLSRLVGFLTWPPVEDQNPVAQLQPVSMFILGGTFRVTGGRKEFDLLACPLQNCILYFAMLMLERYLLDIQRNRLKLTVENVYIFYLSETYQLLL